MPTDNGLVGSQRACVGARSVDRGETSLRNSRLAPPASDALVDSQRAGVTEASGNSSVTSAETVNRIRSREGLRADSLVVVSRLRQRTLRS